LMLLTSRWRSSAAIAQCYGGLPVSAVQKTCCWSEFLPVATGWPAGPLLAKTVQRGKFAPSSAR